MVSRDKTPTPPRPNARERRKQDTRDEIVAAGIKVFRTHGYEGATVDRIAKAAGINRATYYRHFRDKDELSLEIGKATVSGFLEAMPAVAQATTKDELRAGLETVLAARERNAVSFGVGFRSSVASAHFLGRDMEIRSATLEIFKRHFEPLPAAELPRAQIRLILLIDQLNYAFFEFLVRKRPISRNELLDALSDIWWAELGATLGRNP